jgi:UDP-glucose 4-epimerase
VDPRDVNKVDVDAVIIAVAAASRQRGINVHDVVPPAANESADRASNRQPIWASRRLHSPLVRVLVTGGAGFIGTNLVARLLNEPGISGVNVLDDLSASLTAPPTECTFVHGSVLDQASVQTAADGCSAIVHLAAVGSVPRSVADPMRSLDVNVLGTAAVLQAARHNGAHVIVASSSSVYGANPTLPKHEGLVPQPLSPYAVSKLATETSALAWSHCYQLPTLALRFFNVYGPHQPPDHDYAAVIPRFCAAALRGEPLPVHGDGSQSRDFTFVDTVVDVIVDAVHRRVSHATPVNLALGTRCTLIDVIAELEALLGGPLHRLHQPSRAGDVPHSQADPTLLLALFPAATASSLRDGIATTVEWMRTHLGVA